jgi:hypothetical protein
VIEADELIGRNAGFAAGSSLAGLTVRPGVRLRVVGCEGAQVDPSCRPGRISRCASRVCRIPVSDLDAKAVADPGAFVRVDVDVGVRQAGAPSRSLRLRLRLRGGHRAHRDDSSRVRVPE